MKYIKLNGFNTYWYRIFQTRPCSLSTFKDALTISRERKIHLTNGRTLQTKEYKVEKNKQNCNDEIDTDSCDEKHGKYNQVNIQMLYDGLHKQIFGKTERPHVTTEKLHKIKQHLEEHGLWGKSATVLKEINLQLPTLAGNIDSHFRHISGDLNRPYRELADDLCISNIPPMPKVWSTQDGWTKYDPETGASMAVSFPDCDGLVFDVEVLMSEGQYPTMATAASTKAWYSWVSPRVFRKNNYKAEMSLSDMISLETACGSHAPPSGQWKPKLIIGHNVGFDRSFITEQYYIKGSKMKFLDTMSMHIAISGLTSTQRILFKAHQKGESGASRKEIRDMMQSGFTPSFRWTDESSLNNLADVHKLYCPDQPPLQKQTRDVFVAGDMNDVREQFQNLMSYCATDVKATHSIFQKLFTQFLIRFPHPVTLYGMLEMSTAYLPVNSAWQKYIDSADRVYREKQAELRDTLVQLANEARETDKKQQYKNDLWLWDLEWEYVNTLTPLTEKDSKRPVPKTSDKKKPRVKYSYPKWFAGLCPRPAEVSEEFPLGPSKISTLRRITPKLLRLTWQGYPLHYDQGHGWGYLKPSDDMLTQESMDDVLVELTQQENAYQESDEIVTSKDWFPLRQFIDHCKQIPENIHLRKEKNHQLLLEREIADLEVKLQDSIDNETRIKLMGELKDREKALKKIQKKKKKRMGIPEEDGSYDIGITGVKFVPLPHKDGPKNRVGNPLAKDFLPFIEEGTLSSTLGDGINTVLRSTIMCSYWKNTMKRVHEQIALKLPEETLPDCVKSCELYKTDPYVGAILPRVVTAGTITRRAVEKTWLTASNAYPDRIGSELKSMVQSPPGYCFVGADVDSQELWIAAVLGDSHFGGVHGCTALGWMTLQGNKADATDLHSKTAAIVGISRDQAKIFNYGRIYGAGQRFAKRLLLQFNHRMTESEALKKAKNMYEATKGKKRKFLRVLDEEEDNDDSPPEEFDGQWYGGSESAMFNKLESIAESDQPTTPVLGGKISKSLEPKKVHSDFMTSRVNWVVQSSAVDYLHLMLVCTKWLFEKYHIQGRFSISIHDEVRYLVAEEDKDRAALALQITNLLTRCMFAYRLGMNDLPQSVAFFSAIDIDRCLRKETHLDCKTPSNPLGLKDGYNIPPGEALTVYDIIERTAGSLEYTDKDYITWNGSN